MGYRLKLNLVIGNNSSFNSLYGIHGSLIYTPIQIIWYFQFPLWDTLNKSKSSFISLSSFNSLYGILCPKNPKNLDWNGTFNSLYGILSMGSTTITILLLSIPFMGYLLFFLNKMWAVFSTFNSLYGIQ